MTAVREHIDKVDELVGEISDAIDDDHVTRSQMRDLVAQTFVALHSASEADERVDDRIDLIVNTTAEEILFLRAQLDLAIIPFEDQHKVVEILRILSRLNPALFVDLSTPLWLTISGQKVIP